MRKLIDSFITSTSAQPIKQGTLDHLQFAYQEAITAIVNNLMGGVLDNISVYVLYGCVNSGTYPTYNVTAGAVYYSGEVYLVDAFTFTVTPSNKAVGNIVITYYNVNADPTEFTDGSSHNVHAIRKVVFAEAVSGTGISDFEMLKQTAIVLKNDQEASLPGSYLVTFEQDRAVFFAAASTNCTITFDFTNAVPGAVVRLKWTFSGAETLTITAGAGQTIIKDSGNLAAVGSSNNLLYFVYLGKNESGNDEVSYTLKQV